MQSQSDISRFCDYLIAGNGNEKARRDDFGRACGIYSKDGEADRAFLRETCGLDPVDAGGGWLIFSLPKAEAAVHPVQRGGSQELFFTCNDVAVLRADLQSNGVASSDLPDEGWGVLMRITLPSGAQLGVYQPRHARPG